MLIGTNADNHGPSYGFKVAWYTRDSHWGIRRWYTKRGGRPSCYYINLGHLLIHFGRMGLRLGA